MKLKHLRKNIIIGTTAGHDSWIRTVAKRLNKNLQLLFYSECKNHFFADDDEVYYFTLSNNNFTEKITIPK